MEKSKRIELNDETVETVAGGKITFTWTGSTGTIGLNGNMDHTLNDYNAFITYYQENKATLGEQTILNNLQALGIIS